MKDKSDAGLDIVTKHTNIQNPTLAEHKGDDPSNDFTTVKYPEREKCIACHGTGQPGGVRGGAELGLCHVCGGSGYAHGPLRGDRITGPMEGVLTFRPVGNNIHFNFLTLTNDGKIVIGPGMAMEEATQKAAHMLADTYSQLHKDQAARIEKLEAALLDIAKARNYAGKIARAALIEETTLPERFVGEATLASLPLSEEMDDE